MVNSDRYFSTNGFRCCMRWLIYSKTARLSLIDQTESRWIPLKEILQPIGALNCTFPWTDNQHYNNKQTSSWVINSHKDNK